MSSTAIGAIIKKIRQEKEISLKELSMGIFSPQMLKKIENDETDVDIFTMEILLQRLGKSTDKLEIILSDEEYDKLELRDRMEELIWKGERCEVEKLLEEYEHTYVGNSRVQRMFLFRMRSYISYNMDKQPQNAEAYIRQAIAETAPGINNDNMQKYLLSRYELENLLALGRYFLEQNRMDEAGKLLQICRQYIETNVTDQGEFAKIYSKLAWLYAKFYIAKKAYATAYEICESAMEHLRTYGILYFMLPLLEQMLYSGEKLGKDMENSRWKCFYEALTYVYREYGEAWYCQDSLFHNRYQTTYYLASELIRQERRSQGLTQEKLIEGVYENFENLSRVEQGKVMPSKRSLEGLLHNLGMERTRYSGSAIVEDYEVLEHKRKMDILIGQGHYEEAQKVLNQFEKEIDIETKENDLAMKIYQIMIDIGLQKQDNKVIYNRLENLLEENGIVVDGEIKTVPFYNELLVINMMCTIQQMMNKNGTGWMLYDKVVKLTKQSKVDVKYKNTVMSLMLVNRNVWKYEKQSGNYGIRYELLCDKGKNVYMYLAKQGEVCEDINAKRALTRMAFYMSDLFHRDVNKGRLKERYRREFGETLI